MYLGDNEVKQQFFCLCAKTSVLLLTKSWDDRQYCSKKTASFLALLSQFEEILNWINSNELLCNM